jgi:DNA replication protein DnaC
MMNNQTVEQLLDMRLRAMRDEFNRQTELPALMELSFEERFGMIVQAEWNCRQDRKYARLVKGADLPDKTALLADIDFDAPRGIRKSQVATLSSCDWIRRGQFLFLTGASGSGKTWIASAFAAEACRRRYSVKCHRFPRLLRQLGAAQLDNMWGREMDAIRKTDLLVLDDFAMDRMDAAQARDFLEIVDDRTRERRSMIITSQRPVSQWHDLFDDKTVADAILDRLVNNSHRIELHGESMRTRNRPPAQAEE